jgi:hypothetical protein
VIVKLSDVFPQDYGTFVLPFLGPFEKLRKAVFNLAMSVRLYAWNNSAPAGRIFIKFYM